MKIIRNSLIPVGKEFSAINLFGILFVKHDVTVSERLVNHEKIHTAQMRELLYLPFYIIYVMEWLCLFVKYKGSSYEAYKNISFEKEAYRNETNLKYLSGRKRFAQWK